MPFVRKPRTFKCNIGTVTIGEGDNAITIGGQNVLPLQYFDEAQQNKPAIGVEVTDTGYATKGLPKLTAFYEGAESFADRVKRACEMPGADFICMHFEGADPGGENRPTADCVAMVKEAAAVCTKPIAVMGCKNIEKDSELFSAIADALQGKNVLFLSAREEDYKTIGASTALAYGHNTGAESAVDINLAKQLNVLMTQLGVPAGKIAMNLGSASAGYGYEYVSSTMDRVKAAALEQNDAMLQMPVVTPISTETWGVKESIVSEDDVPEWGDMEQRGIQMEIVTASACLASGSDALILRHPVSVEKMAALTAAMM